MKTVDVGKNVESGQKVKSLLGYDYSDYSDWIIEELGKHSNNELRVAILAHSIFEDIDGEVYDQYFVDGDFELHSDPSHDSSYPDSYSSRQESEMDSLILCAFEEGIKRRIADAVEFEELEG